jgi:hypothetical protein
MLLYFCYICKKINYETFTPQEIEESFKGMSLFNEKNLNL